MNFDNSNINIRELILKILIRVEKENAYLNIVTQKYLNKYNIKNNKDKALIQEICYGVTRFRKKIDWIIDQFLDKKNKKLPLILRNILRIGVYQILYLDRIPDYAICNESVKMTKNSQYSEKAKLVNALLRNIIRRMDSIEYPEISKDPVKYISVFYSFPEWFIKRWIERFGLDLCIELCKASNMIPSLTLRINTLKVDMLEFKKNLSELRIDYKEGNILSDEAVIVRNFFNIVDSKIFSDGLFSIQDESSMLSSRLLNPLPGELIIDMCSGPGGKTTHMAQLMDNYGEIVAFEKNKKRLEMVKGECSRMGIDIVRPILQDATQPCRSFFEKADKILADVPCSGTGVIRKKPDLKWKKMSELEFNQLNLLQGSILNTASYYLKPGGELLYSTCSLEKEENDDIVSKFLKKRSEFQVEDTDYFVRENNIFKFNTEIKQAIQLLPGYSGKDVDGFYMVKIKKSGK